MVESNVIPFPRIKELNSKTTEIVIDPSLKEFLMDNLGINITDDDGHWFVDGDGEMRLIANDV